MISTGFGAHLLQENHASVEDIALDSLFTLTESSSQGRRHLRVQLLQEVRVCAQNGGQGFGSASANLPADVLIISVLLLTQAAKYDRGVKGFN